VRTASILRTLRSTARLYIVAMRLAALALLATSLVAALPMELTEFFLVTSDQATPSANSSQLRGVHATTPYVSALALARILPPAKLSQAEDPISQSTLLLRLIGPGYNILPNFTLADGVLSTVTSGPHNIGSYKYNSTTVTTNSQLQFVARPMTNGNVGLKDGYLLSVGGESEGWTICDSVTGPDVLVWKGTDESCVKTYLQAVSAPPYRRA